MIAALLLAAASPEAQALAQRLAASGEIATLLPMIAAKETEELVAQHPALTEGERAQLRATATRTRDAAVAKIVAAQAAVYAAELPEAELRLLVATRESAAGQHYRAVQPKVIAATMQGMAGVDFKRDTLATFCRETGKACPAK